MVLYSSFATDSVCTTMEVYADYGRDARRPRIYRAVVLPNLIRDGGDCSSDN